MKLINTDGMAFIGPGSEWFWTALTGLVLGVTFLAIYPQLVIARSASAREQLEAFDREWDAERMLRHRLALLVALHGGADPAHLPDGSAAAVANFWDRTGQLARSGDLDRKALYSSYSTVCQTWWAALAPAVRRWRAEAVDPRRVEDFEWLAGRMAEMDRRVGQPVFDERRLGQLVDPITRLREELHVEEALRTVIVASADALTVAAHPSAPVADPIA